MKKLDEKEELTTRKEICYKTLEVVSIIIDRVKEKTATPEEVRVLSEVVRGIFNNSIWFA